MEADVYEKSVCIEVTQMNYDNCGNATIALNYLILHSKRINATKISGFFCNADKDHWHILEKLYSKYGFQISPESGGCRNFLLTL